MPTRISANTTDFDSVKRGATPRWATWNKQYEILGNILIIFFLFGCILFAISQSDKMNFSGKYRILAYRKAREVAEGQEDAFVRGAMWAFKVLRDIESKRKILEEIEMTDKAFAELQNRLNNG